MKHYLLSALLCTSILFAACGQEVSMQCDGAVSDFDAFQVCLPTGVRTVQESFGDDDNIVVQYFNQDDGMNLLRVHVKKDPVVQPVTNHLEFAEQAVSYTRESAGQYVAISTEPIEISSKQSILHVFDSTPDGAEGAIRYYQFVVVHESIAYGFTAVINPDLTEESVATLVQSLTSVRFK